MEIRPNIHAVRLRSSTAFLFAEDELTLIDAGLRGSGRRFAAYLHHVRRSPTELTRLICTHGHPDHNGGVRELATHRGSVCVYARQHRLLFTGDVLQVLRGRLTFASQIFSDDMPMARRSVERLAELDVQTIALSHYPPWSERANEALRALAQRGATA